MLGEYQIPESYRSWIDSRHEPVELKRVAYRAVDCYEQLASGDHQDEQTLDELYEAACHPRFVVWDVGLALLFHLSETSTWARRRIEAMAGESKAELRRRSFQYLSDDFPRTFCVKLLSGRLADRSAKVRGLAASRIETLGLRELLPHLEEALAKERNDATRSEMKFAMGLLRDNYYERENNGYALVLRNGDRGPGGTVWISQFRMEPLSAERVREIGIDVIRNEVLGHERHQPIRLWRWKA